MKTKKKEERLNIKLIFEDEMRNVCKLCGFNYTCICTTETKNYYIDIIIEIRDNILEDRDKKHNVLIDEGFNKIIKELDKHLNFTIRYNEKLTNYILSKKRRYFRKKYK